MMDEVAWVMANVLIPASVCGVAAAKVGAWFKKVTIGGAAPSRAAFIVDSEGRRRFRITTPEPMRGPNALIGWAGGSSSSGSSSISILSWRCRYCDSECTANRCQNCGAPK